ncbi:MAG: SGNH/GDSL hydrolase family protein [Deltaproteobacteria bacterium]|nr:SGNH/GDSL hydrolase family protein [Deltaproteobacteria bacterium]MBI3294652.1 SGNH/GDSL hydrolase family protein [Deltaproteobacteria bacterium]
MKQTYLYTAQVVLSAVLLFIVINLLSAVFISLKPPQTAPGLAQGEIERKLEAAYGGTSTEEIAALLNETWRKVKLEPTPWTHFAEAPFAGRYVNVSRQGIRSNGRPSCETQLRPGESPFRIFFFGGSTSWGYGVRDSDTIPAQLERILSKTHPGKCIVVSNYGRGYYFSTQEQALFLSLLRRGLHPNAVIFLDGLNESIVGEYRDLSDEPLNFSAISESWRGAEKNEKRGLALRTFVEELPISKLLVRLRRKIAGGSLSEAGASKEPAIDSNRLPVDQKVDQILAYFLHNRRITELVAQNAGIQSLFFWQPVPLYAYDLKYQLFEMFYSPYLRGFMKSLFERVARLRVPGLINISNLLVKFDKAAYVDSHHYNPEVCGLIARALAEHIKVPTLKH